MADTDAPFAQWHAGQPHRGRCFAAVFPHSDDVTIFAGGLIRKLLLEGFTGYFIRVTNDDKDSSDLSIGATVHQIQTETETVGAALGLRKVYHLNYANHYLHEGQLIEIRHRLITLFRFLCVDTVVSFDPWAQYEENPDHYLTGKAVEAACWMAGRELDLPELSDLGLVPRTVEHRYYAARGPQHVNRRVDVTAVLPAKRAALLLHRTPMRRMWTEHTQRYPDPPLTLEDYVEQMFLELDEEGRHVESFHYRGPQRSERTGA